jgi:hypothetical protein
VVLDLLIAGGRFTGPWSTLTLRSLSPSALADAWHPKRARWHKLSIGVQLPKAIGVESGATSGIWLATMIGRRASAKAGLAGTQTATAGRIAHRQ